MSPELITTLANVPQVIIFAWFVLYRDKVFHKISSDRDAAFQGVISNRDGTWQKFISGRDEQVIEAMNRVAASMSSHDNHIDRLTGQVSQLCSAMLYRAAQDGDKERSEEIMSRIGTQRGDR